MGSGKSVDDNPGREPSGFGMCGPSCGIARKACDHEVGVGRAHARGKVQEGQGRCAPVASNVRHRTSVLPRGNKCVPPLPGGEMGPACFPGQCRCFLHRPREGSCTRLTSCLILSEMVGDRKSLARSVTCKFDGVAGGGGGRGRRREGRGDGGVGEGPVGLGGIWEAKMCGGYVKNG